MCQNVEWEELKRFTYKTKDVTGKYDVLIRITTDDEEIIEKFCIDKVLVRPIEDKEGAGVESSLLR